MRGLTWTQFTAAAKLNSKSCSFLSLLSLGHFASLVIRVDVSIAVSQHALQPWHLPSLPEYLPLIRDGSWSIRHC